MTSGQFALRLNEKKYLAMVSSYSLHGQQLKMGVVIDPIGSMNGWIDPERKALFIAGILLAILITLLVMAWTRKRLSDDRIRKQARRNRSQELKLAKALGEREVLNREVHHRVKNNLQVVSSLLNLQATRLDDGPVKYEFLRGKRRIDTIALVHHKLYGLPDLRNVNLAVFFNDLVKALSELFAPQSRTVSHEVDTDGIKADQDTAIELGIILCELVGNTYQHAFPYATGGHVEIKVRAVEGDLHRLIVKDNGRGIPDGGLQGAGKLGLEIVEALSEQLDGSFHMLTEPGVQFEVLLRMQRGPAVVISEQPVEPVRVEIGPKDVEKNSVALARRDKPGKEGKFFVQQEGLAAAISNLLVEIQAALLQRATEFRDANIHEPKDYDDLKRIVTDGWAFSHWCESRECEAKVKEDTKATTRNIPFNQPTEAGTCIVCGKPSKRKVYFAKAY